MKQLVDTRILQWLFATAATHWHDWHMAHMDHTAEMSEWQRRIHSAHRWRYLAESLFPMGVQVRPHIKGPPPVRREKGS